MDIGSIFLILALAVIVFLFVTRPFFVQSGDERLVANPEAIQKEHQRSALLAERDRVLNTLQELEADNALGKVPEEDYKTQREVLLKSGAEVLRQLDTFKLEDSRKDNKPGFVKEDDELEALIAARRQGKRTAAGSFCTNCGNALQSGDQFCSRCGARTG